MGSVWRVSILRALGRGDFWRADLRKVLALRDLAGFVIKRLFYYFIL
jgi:hypothetical protein